MDWPPTNAAELARRSSTYLLGCRYPAKRSLDKTYVAQAIGYGAEVRSLSEVTALERNAAAYRVYWIDHAVRRRSWSDAPIVVVAAGTLGTLRLLFGARDRDRSLQLPPALGRRFSVGGDTMIVVDNSPDAGESSYGPCPGATVPVARDGQHRFLITEMGVPADALSLPKPVRRRLQHSLVLAGMGRDASTGVVEFDGRELRTGTDRSLDPELFAELESTMTQIAQAYRPRRILPSVRPHSGQLVTVHPSGAAAIGDGPEQGVVDHMGQVFGNPGLYVADASLFPHAPGLPPAMTIAALAERQAALIGRPVVRERSTSPAPYRAHSPTAGQCADATHRASQQEGHAAGGITSRPPASGALGSGARGGTMLAERIYRQTNRLYDRARSPAAIDAARVEPIGGMDQLGGHRYCVLISYRRDGTPVASPLWFGLQEGRLYVRTGAATAKLQRIRRHPQVRVAHRPCGEYRLARRLWARRGSWTSPKNRTPSERSAPTIDGSAGSIFGS